MKKHLIFLAILLILPLVLAVNLEVEQQSSDEVMILGLNEPAIFDLNIKNNGSTDTFILYTFFGSTYSPKESFQIAQDETKNIQFTIYPPSDISRTGFTKFDYFIQGSDHSEHEGELLVKVIELEEAFEIGSGEINPESNSLEIYIRNKVNFNFEELNVKFSSVFFELEETFSLSPEETKTFQITLDKEEFKKLTAGFYTLSAEINTDDKTAEVEGIIKFVEQNTITTDIENYGFVVRTKIITKSNDGNVVQIVQTNMEKNIISRLFTSFNPQPDNVNREGFQIDYTWNRELKPGEILEVKVKTNWFLPLLCVLFIVGIVLFVKEYIKTNLKLKKKITFVKSKGGEFALKISLFVHAKKQMENVVVIERIPPILKLYDKFGKEHPVRVDDKTKKAEWEFKRLEAGERRIITYIVYSKVGVLGKFALPRALGIYEKDGKIHETSSNKVFFLTEQVKGE